MNPLSGYVIISARALLVKTVIFWKFPEKVIGVRISPYQLVGQQLKKPTKVEDPPPPSPIED